MYSLVILLMNVTQYGVSSYLLWQFIFLVLGYGLEHTSRVVGMQHSLLLSLEYVAMAWHLEWRLSRAENNQSRELMSLLSKLASTKCGQSNETMGIKQLNICGGQAHRLIGVDGGHEAAFSLAIRARSFSDP
jgi:hypothetical protein